MNKTKRYGRALRAANANTDGRGRKHNREQRQARRRYWLTPKAWNKSCSHCGAASSIAFRPDDGKHACEPCIERLGINAQESKAWRDGGSRAGSTVRVRFVDPESLRRAA